MNLVKSFDGYFQTVKLAICNQHDYANLIRKKNEDQIITLTSVTFKNLTFPYSHKY